jgi:hypothetical protein
LSSQNQPQQAPTTHYSSNPPKIAPRGFSLTEPFAVWGWLPSGVTKEGLWANGQGGQVESLEAGGHGGRGLSLDIGSARYCRLARGSGLSLDCGSDGVSPVLLAGRAPDVHGGTAYWVEGGGVAWVYAKNGWAWMTSSGVSKGHVLKVAGTLRYNSDAYRYGFTWHGAPAGWTTGSFFHGVQFTFIGGQPTPLGWYFGPVSHAETALEISAIPVADHPFEWACGGQYEYLLKGGKRVTLDGTKATLVTVNKNNEHYQALCDGSIHGDRMQILLYSDGRGTSIPVAGVKKLGGVLGVFRNLRLLGTNIRNWTTNPLH